MALKPTKKHAKPVIGLVMGSQSDWETMRNAGEILTQFGISFEVGIVSAHRTPERLVAYAKSAATRGLRVIIAGAGGCCPFARDAGRFDDSSGFRRSCA